MPDAQRCTATAATRAIQRMVEFAPSTGGLALWVRHSDLRARAGPHARAGGDDRRHHGVLRRGVRARCPCPNRPAWSRTRCCTSRCAIRSAFVELQRLIGDVDLELFNICADAIVNRTLAHLSWLRLPADVGLSRADARHGRWAESRTSRRRCSNGTSSGCTAPSTIAGSRRDRAAAGQASRSGPGDAAGQRRIEAARHRASERASAQRRDDGPRAARVRELGARTARAICCPARTHEAPPEAERTRRANGASGSCAAMPATARSRCCAR